MTGRLVSAAMPTRMEHVAMERASLHVMAQRRRKILRGSAVVALLVAAMILLSVATRDIQDMRRCCAQLEFIREKLGPVTASNSLPFKLPQPDDPRTALVGHYRYMPSNASLPRGDHPVAIVCCDRPHSMMIRPDGRYALVLEGSSYKIKWMTESDFAAAANQLGIEPTAKRP